MNRFVKTALAIAVAGSAAHAGTGDNEWAALDSEISGLASSLKQSQDSMGWSALLRVVYTYSKDDIATGGGEDTSGLNFNDADIAIWGAQGPYAWRISADIDDNEAGQLGAQFELEDAWVKWTCGEYFDAHIGNMKPRVSRSNSVDPEKLLFIDRSPLGSAFDGWDNGVAATGRMEQIFWGAWILNGSNGHVSDHLIVARGEFDIGTGAGEYEGAMGSQDTLNGTFGLSFVNDDATATPGPGGGADTSLWLFDFHGSVSQFGFGFELAKLDDDIQGATDEDYSNIIGLNLYGDSEPFSVYGSYAINPEWEVAVRYDDLDNKETAGGANAEDNTVLSVAANYYRGPGAKWQAQYSMYDADSAFPDGDVFEVGLVIGSTR
jgi:hypothetical protein